MTESGFGKIDSMRFATLKQAQKKLIEDAIKNGGSEGVKLSSEDIEELKSELDELKDQQ